MNLFVKYISISAVYSFCSVLPVNGQNRPNILFCIADDASYPHFGANGSKWVKTPGFDRIAKEGILFSNCYTPNAKSAPSRACVLTGLYSWQLGEAGNHICKFPANRIVVTDALKENDYEVAYTGKGWAPGTARTKDGKLRSLNGIPFQKHTLIPPTPQIGKNDYTANFKEFLDQAKTNVPWFFWIGFTEPHRAYTYGSGEEVGGKTKEMIDKVPVYWPDNDVIRTDMLDYACEIEYMDKHLAAILNELDKRGILDNTIVAFTSDNGMPFPRSKANDYEMSNHMPLAIMWKNRIKNPGRTVTDYVNFVDFAPTFLEASHTDPEKHGMTAASGKSLLEIFFNGKEGTVTNNRNYTLLGRERDDYGRPRNQGYPIRAIIQDSLLYIYNMKPELMPAGNPETGYLDVDGSLAKTEILNMRRNRQNNWYYQLSFGKREAEELYNLSVDKDCIINLAGNPLYQEKKKRMKETLFQDLRRQSDPRMTGNGDVFDQYPFYQDNAKDFFERVTSGEVEEPWKQTGWVNKSDYGINNE
ncbi:MAG: sulfatase [Tannerellaceae bacterium]|jgi:arylsulfatase A-like enzyme|nr:sulfatase [Tannerellaceae bacterium]